MNGVRFFLQKKNYFFIYAGQLAPLLARGLQVKRRGPKRVSGLD